MKTGPNTSSRATDIEFLTSVSSVGAKNQSRGRPAGRSPPQARVAPSCGAEATTSLSASLRTLPMMKPQMTHDRCVRYEVCGYRLHSGLWPHRQI